LMTSAAASAGRGWPAAVDGSIALAADAAAAAATPGAPALVEAARAAARRRDRNSCTKATAMTMTPAPISKRDTSQMASTTLRASMPSAAPTITMATKAGKTSRHEMRSSVLGALDRPPRGADPAPTNSPSDGDDGGADVPSVAIAFEALVVRCFRAVIFPT